MKSRLPVVLLEFNELSPVLMERFIAGGLLPNFRRLRDSSAVFVTESEEPAPNLDPWIQWVNVHTGVPQAEHGISRLSQGHKLRQRCVWDLVAAEGDPVWICGSMNIRYDEGAPGYFVPDPWATDVKPHPDSLTPYFRFVQQNVLEYSNQRVPLTKADYLNFLRFMAGHGLSWDTVSSTLQQLVSEKTQRKVRWRRAFIQDKLQFDVFRSVYVRIKPSFSTFFLNSTAHMQHVYWRNMEPEHFALAPSPEEQDHFASAILHGYQEMDDLVGRMFKLLGDNAIIMMATALSQQPCLSFEATGGKHGHRVIDLDALTAFAGITRSHRSARAMAGQFWVHMQNAADAADAETKLAALHVGEQRALLVKREEASVFVSCAINRAVDREAVVRIADSESSIPFFEMFHQVEEMKSGMHHRDGILWIRHPQRPHSIHEDKVGLIAIAPTILDMLGMEKPAQMKGASLFSGASGFASSNAEALVTAHGGTAA
jgi:hypothetical protein